jgi:hypothetical protein
MFAQKKPPREVAVGFPSWKLTGFAYALILKKPRHSSQKEPE